MNCFLLNVFNNILFLWSSNKFTLLCIYIYTYILLCSLWLIHTCGARNGTEKHLIVKGIDSTITLRTEPPLDFMVNTYLLFFCDRLSATQKYHISFALFLFSKSNLHYFSIVKWAIVFISPLCTAIVLCFHAITDFRHL